MGPLTEATGLEIIGIGQDLARGDAGLLHPRLNALTRGVVERLFLGGANNLRGFNYRQAGPKDATGEALGGKTSIYATSEFSVPVHITSNTDKSPRIVFFGDIGSIGGASGALLGDGSIYSDVGIGMRLFLPVGPIRVDYAVPMGKDQYSGNGRFQFNMGYKF